MKRLEFLKRLGLGAAAAVVAPSAFISKGNTKFVDADDLKKEELNNCFTSEWSPLASPLTATYVGYVPSYIEIIEKKRQFEDSIRGMEWRTDRQVGNYKILFKSTH